MAIRIKYRATGEPNTLQSIKRFAHPTNGARFKILLNTDKLEYSVVDEVVNVVVATGESKSPHKLRIDVKNALVALGIELQKEERAKRSSV